MNGDLAEGVVPDLLREIYVGRRSGVLNLVRAQERQSLRFRRGHIVNAHTNVLEERLGEMLVRRGYLSEADLARATEVVVRDARRLGEVLAEMGLLDASGLEDAVALHVHEMLARVFAWHEGTYAFEEQPEGDPGEELTLKLSTGELILEAVQAVRDPDVVRYALGDMDRVLVLSSDPLLRFQSLTLSPADGFVLSRVDGVTSAREIVQMIPLPAEQTQKSLLGLLSTGVVEYAGVRRPRDASAPSHPAPEPPPPPPAAPPPSPPPAAPPPARAPAPAPAPPPPAPAAPHPKAADVPPPSPPARPAATDDKAAERRREILEAFGGLKTRNHFEVLELSRSVGEAEVKEAYFRLAKRFHPDVHHGTSLGDLRDELEAVFIRLGEAYEVLRDPRKRGEYEERLGRQRPRPAAPAAAAGAGPATGSPAEPAAPEPARDPEEEARVAEESIRRAAKLVEQEKYWDAIQLLQPAIDAVQGKSRLRGQLALARCYARNPKWAKEAESVLLAATRESPQAGEAWALLGELYAQKGLRTRAVTMYRKVLELNPDHEEAARFVAANAPEPEPPEDEGGSGLLGRLFKKT
jgi:tetratricopeptide (TPR) repeat protein